MDLFALDPKLRDVFRFYEITKAEVKQVEAELLNMDRS